MRFFVIASTLLLAGSACATEAEMEALKVCNEHHVIKPHSLQSMVQTSMMAWEPGFEGCQAIADKLNAEAAARRAAKAATDSAKIRSLLGQ